MPVGVEHCSKILDSKYSNIDSLYGVLPVINPAFRFDESSFWGEAEGSGQSGDCFYRRSKDGIAIDHSRASSRKSFPFPYLMSSFR